MTITILMGDGSQNQVSDAQTAANLFSQGGEILTSNGTLYQPTEMAGAGTNPDGWLINGITATDYFAPPAAVPPSVSTGVVRNTGPAVGIGILPAATIYRLILPEPDGSYATGANYPGCSQTTSSLCDPQSFPNLQAAIQYATVKGETPVMVSSDTEAWNIVAGNETPSPSQILTASGAAIAQPAQLIQPPSAGLVGSLVSNPLALGALAIGGYFLLQSKPKRGA